MKKILILNDDFRINKTPPGIINSMIINALGTNHSITVLHPSSFSNLPWINKNVKLVSFSYTNKSKKSIIDKIPKVRAIPNIINGFDKNSYSKIRDWATSIQTLVDKEYFDLIFIINGLWFPLFAMNHVKTNIPIIPHIHDPFPLINAPKPYKHKFNLRDLSRHYKLKKIFNKSYAVTFPSKLLIDWMRNYYPKLKDKSLVLPHIYMHLKNIGNSTKTKDLLPKNKFNITYLGNLYIRDIEHFVKACELLIKDNNDFKNDLNLTIIGNISKKNLNALNQIKKNVTIIKDRISFVDSVEIIKNADIQLIIEAIMEVSPFLPSKIAYIVGNNKPFIALTPKVSEIRRIVGNNYPYLALPNKTNEIKEALELAWKNWKKNNLNLIDKELKNYFSPEYFVNTFNEILKMNK